MSLYRPIKLKRVIRGFSIALFVFLEVDISTWNAVW